MMLQHLEVRSVGRRGAFDSHFGFQIAGLRGLGLVGYTLDESAIL